MNKVKSKKEIVFLLIWLFAILFLPAWRDSHSLIEATIRATIGTVGGAIVGLAFVALWAQTHSLVIAFVVVACGATAALACLNAMLSR